MDDTSLKKHQHQPTEVKDVQENVIAIVHSEWVKLGFSLANWKQK